MPPLNTSVAQGQVVDGPIRPPDTRLGRIRLVAVLGLLVALGPLTIDMYLPALPELGYELHVTSTLAQLTLTGTMLGLGLGQLLAGPLVDSLGRRRPLFAGIGLHIVASLAIMIAPNIAVLGLLRVIQGMGAAATTVVALAVVRDLYTDSAAAVVLSRLMLVIGIAPILAPSFGAAVLLYGSWRHVFGVLACLGSALLVLAVVALRETLPVAHRRPLRARTVALTYRDLLRDKVFLGLVGVGGLSISALFAYVAGAPFVFQGQYGMSEQLFAVVFGSGAVAMAVASQVNAALLKRFEPQRIVFVALVVAVAATAVLLTTASTGFGRLPGFVVPLWTVLAITGLVLPNAPALALSRHGEAAGSAAALLGATQFGAGALVAPLVGELGNDARAVAIVSLGAVVLALLVLVLVRRQMAPRGALTSRHERGRF
jgi:DHA1 family bicyclomycin/chloramphenicol resistance-like MFS transporter